MMIDFGHFKDDKEWYNKSDEEWCFL